ncbi:hypothetical protein [Nocardia sp. NPDC020380]|uniref:hypothetical protein n=1 Tax=Nocardia sp. NPDC020380 TaxID=3364309 RepID=UPI0037A4D47C
MRTVVNETETLGTDLGFDSIPVEIRNGRLPAPVATRVPRRPVLEQRACRARLQPVPRDRARAGRVHVVERRVATRAHGRHPLTRVQRAQVGFAALAVTALVSALAVAGLIGLAQLRAGNFDSQTAPVVQMSPAR